MLAASICSMGRPFSISNRCCPAFLLKSCDEGGWLKLRHAGEGDVAVESGSEPQRLKPELSRGHCWHDQSRALPVGHSDCLSARQRYLTEVQLLLPQPADSSKL